MPPGNASLPDDHLPGRAGLGIDLLDSIVGHVGDEDAIPGVDRQVVERRLELRDHLLRAGLRIDPHQLAKRGIHHPQIALGIEIDRGRNLEAIGDHRQLGLVDIDPDDLALEPQWAVQHAVGTEFEAIEATHLLHDLARRLDALDIDLVERVAEENLRRVEPAIPAKRQRVDAGQAGGELLDRPVALAGVEVASEKPGPRHGAVGRERDVVRHPLGSAYRDFRGAVDEIDLVQCRARHAAGEQASGGVDAEPVHTVKRRAGNKFCHFIRLRRCADAGGQKNCRRDRRTQCKPALHDATSWFLCWASIRRGRLFGKRNLAAAKRGVAATTGMRSGCVLLSRFEAFACPQERSPEVSKIRLWIIGDRRR